MKTKLMRVVLLLILSVSPVLAQTPTFPMTVKGAVNSGGVACFNSTTQESSSATLPANYVVLGGGAGSCPKTSSGLFSDLLGDLTANSLFTDLIDSSGANDLVIQDNSIERLRLPSGHPTISVTVNKPATYIYPTEPALGTTPTPATVEIFNASTDSKPFDQLSLTNPLGTNRRAGIMFQSYCDSASAYLTSCVPSSQADEYEMGVDSAPNGGHNFYLIDEVSSEVVFQANVGGYVCFGVTSCSGSENGEIFVTRLGVRGSTGSTVPTCTIDSGFMFGAGSCAVEASSSDSAGRLNITVGPNPSGNMGYVKLLFSSSFGTPGFSPMCFIQASNENAGSSGYVNWSTTPAAKVFFSYTTRGAGVSNTQAYWTVDNSAAPAPWSSGNVLQAVYVCVGK